MGHLMQVNVSTINNLLKFTPDFIRKHKETQAEKNSNAKTNNSFAPAN